MKQRYLILTVIWVLGLASTTALAQQRIVSGTIKDSRGAILPGVNIIVKGTSAGTVSDAYGKYALSLPENAATLVFSFIGYASKEVEIGNQTSIDVGLEEDVKQLSEVVVTALGIERTTKALQSSVTQVSGENFTQARELGFANQLAGRVAGVNVSRTASGPAGSTRVVIRGAKTLANNLGANQPLYVIDGIPMDNSNNGQSGVWGGPDRGDGLNSLSPDDIQSMTVLKGASAAALYGSRAAFGVILVTTKKGTARKGIGIEINSNLVAEKVINYTDFQTTYGTGALVGATPSSRVATKATTLADWPTAFNGGWFGQAWGPKYDGSDALNSDGVVRKYNYAGDNFKRFFHTGLTSTNSIALSGGSETQNFRFSYAKLKNNDVLPGTGFSRDNFSMASNSKFGKKVTLVSKVLYSHEEAKNRPFISDSPGNAVQAVYKTMANEDVTIFKQGPKLGAVPVGMTTPDNKPVGAEFQRSNDLWGANPYWAAYQFINNDTRDRVNASANLKYDITSFLYTSGQAGMDWYTQRAEGLTPEGTGYQSGGSMNESETRVREINLQWILGFDKTISKFHVNAFVGGNRMRNSWERINISGNNFNVPFFPAITNVALKNWDYGYSASGINSLFGSGEVSYDNYLFLTGTYRRDWFSVLDPGHKNWSAYPSVGASFVFSDAFKELPPAISFGKLRASWGQVGSINSAAGAYSINNTYSLGGTPHLGRPLGYFTRANSTNSGVLPNKALIPLLSTELEFGLDVRFFNNRLGLDVAYYDQKTTNDILNANISQASGWTATQLNIGKLSNKGVEILLTGTPIKGPITWDVSLNFAKNVNKVVSLIAGQNELTDEEPRTRTVRVKHIVGLPYGYITGYVQSKTPDGRLIYDINGTPQTDGKYYQLGSGVANFTGGLNNSITYKSFTLGVLFDFKSGGKIYSGTNVRMTGWGFTKQTLAGRDGEAPLTVTGAVQSGTDASGNPVYTDFSKQLTPGEAQLYWSAFATRAQDKFMYDASFIKLRQLTFGYSVPKSVLSSTPFQTVSVSFVARNLATLLKHTPNIDPESSYTSSNAQGLDYFGMPPTRSYGFNVRLTF
jgi:TonB-linked SusC/RagA family outer membrane protein